MAGLLTARAASLVPEVDAYHACPYCAERLLATAWHVVGMRNLADLRCPACKRAFIGDLPTGHGLYFPALIEVGNGAVHTPHGAAWFGDWLAQGYAERAAHPLEVAIDGRADGPEVMLLNCLDTLYGHALLKLLTAQAHLSEVQGPPLLVLVQKSLRWLVPDGVAETWSIDLPLKSGTLWSDWLDEQLHTRLQAFDRVWLAPAYAHPHPSRVAIEQFSRVTPFALDEWESRARVAQKVTFVWREDRLWREADTPLPRGLRGLRHRVVSTEQQVNAQRDRVVDLAEALEARLERLDFAVVGLGLKARPSFPERIADLRQTNLDAGAERAWCARYAESHVVIGVHGSNLLLPSAHAATTLDLMPGDRWTNALEDLLVRDEDAREALFAYRLLPIATPMSEVAEVVVSLFEHRAAFLIAMRDEFSNPTQPLSPETYLQARRERLAHPPA